MSRYLVPLHPADLPHADTLGVSPWVQWTVVAVVIGLGVWLIVNARLERSGSARPGNLVDEPTGETAIVRPQRDIGGEVATAGAASSREQLVRVARPAPSKAKRLSRQQSATSTTASAFNSVQLFVTIFAFAAGWEAIDRVRAVDAMGSFVRTDGATQVARLGFAFAALLWVGGALAPVAPRGSAAIFLVASSVAAFLATPERWEVRLEWWGARSVLGAWSSLPLWAAAAVLFAVVVISLDAVRARWC